MSTTAQELIDVIAGCYRDKPDEYVVSVGHWVDEQIPDLRGNFINLPRFSADIKLTAGEIRALASEIERLRAALHLIEAREAFCKCDCAMHGVKIARAALEGVKS